MEQVNGIVKTWYKTALAIATATRWIFLVIIAGLLIVSTTSCKKDKLGTPPREFSIPVFKQRLQTGISNSASTQPRGYSFIISSGGNIADSSSFGTARANLSGLGAVPWNTNQEINIASVSKTMTAVAAFKLIKKNNLSNKSKIGDWLPAYWNAAQAVKDITFEQLLMHTSGLSEGNTSYDSLIATAGRGLDDPTRPYRYANINFALFRAMVPYLDNKNAAVSKEQSMLPGNPSGFETWLSNEYVKYMQENVFDPISLSDATCIPSATTAQAYGESNGMGSNVANQQDWTNMCGGGGYYMSVKEMARFIAYLGHTNTLLDKETRDFMDANHMGWDPNDSPMTTAGKAQGKGGALWWDTNNNNIQEAGEPGLQTLIVKFPNGIDLALAINSIPGQYRNISSIVLNAYNGAWIDK
jgi:D-alanyl-D-alanine carboxypeptidase